MILSNVMYLQMLLHPKRIQFRISSLKIIINTRLTYEQSSLVSQNTPHFIYMLRNERKKYKKNVIVLNENSSVNFLSRFIETISPSSSEQKKRAITKSVEQGGKTFRMLPPL